MSPATDHWQRAHADYLSVLLFKQTEQPTVLKGNIATCVASVLQVAGLLTILVLSKRDLKREQEEDNTVPEDEAPRYPSEVQDLDSKR